ncbi:MAG: DNA starvation/stationary phase protection protein Dps [Gemmatimonadales bacterium]
MTDTIVAMNPTRNDLAESVRGEVAAALNQRLADCIDLERQCKQAHWNVKGPSFVALHQLFDQVASEAAEYADLLAERVVQLGGVAEGAVQVVAARTTLPPYPTTITSGPEHLAALADALARFGREARAEIDRLGSLGDADAADILTEISRGIDKRLWFVEAHLQGG